MTRSRLRCSRLCPFAALAAALLVLLAGLLQPPAAFAQRQVEFRGSIPVAPTGLAGKPLAKGPFEYPTAEGMDIRVDVLARGIVYPTSLAFLPGGGMLVATRTGDLWRIEDGRLLPDPVRGVPDSVFEGETGMPGTVHGLIDIALHPAFADNGLIYLSYSKPHPQHGHTLAVGRGAWNGSALEDFEDLWLPDARIQGASRIAFDGEGKLYITASGADPQDLGTLGGKVLRLNDDGSVPGDNPFVDREDARPEIYTLGHRGSLGLAVHPETGEVWQNENGPNGGDEINVLRPGANYGWPVVSLGRTYQGPWQSERPTHEGFEPPVVYWMPSIAVSGMTFYTGDALPAWKGDVFVGALRTGEIPGTGHIERILFNENMEELRRESLLTDLRQRIRDIRQGPDGLLYAVTEERDGAVLRIAPAE